MQAVQPQGPYFLGGHSYGGNVAFEMAQQLRNQGQEVALLAIVDSSAPTYKDKQMLIDYINWDHARWLVEVSKGIEVYLEKNVDISYDTLQSLTVDEQLKYVLHYFKMANMLPPNAEITQLTNIVQAYKNSCLCLVDYVPKQPYPGKLTILRANEDLPEDPNGYLNAEVSQDLSLGWSEFSSEPVDIHFVLGNHITIMVEPHVQVLAEKLAITGADLLIETLYKLERQEVTPIPQDHTAATYASLIQKPDYNLDWGQSAIQLHNQIRGFYPNCTATFRNQALKITATVPLEDAYIHELPEPLPEKIHKIPNLSTILGQPGEVVNITKGLGAIVQTGVGLLLLREVQLTGKRPQSGWDFVNGTRLTVGEVMGNG
jgi:thioesterase domain-containing protein